MTHHILNTGYSVDKRSLKLIRNALDRKLLGPFESLETIEGDNMMN